ncbi:MAG: glycoside hydrolase, partial [Pseudomonadota bacterium]
DPEAWARVLRPVLEDGGLRAEMALAARRDIEKRPDWGVVFEEDLLALWRALGRRALAQR